MIEPAVVSLSAGDSVAFSTDGAHWTHVPSVGHFDSQTGVYRAPGLIINSRTVYITAAATGNPAAGGTAEIRLTSSAFWMTALSLYWPAVFLVVFFWGWAIWPGIPPEPVLMVNPPAVTLGGNQNQQFAATLDDRPDQDITWSATSGKITPTGFYLAPAVGATEQTVSVTATRNSDKTKTASAIVVLSSDNGLFLYPALSHVQKGGTVVLTGAGGKGAIAWPDEAPNGRYTAPKKIDQRHVVDISITDKAGHVASARIVLLPDGSGTGSAPATPSDTTLMAIALLAGALGAWLASVKSFVGFTGTRTFVPSWSLFYLFRPGFGAGLALIVHLAHRMGSVGAGSSATNPAVVALYSALVGLFADEALQKLHDLFCTLFGVQDKRTDKMGQGSAAGPAPTITAANASAARKQISIEGTNFAKTSTVLVDNVARPVSFTSDKSLTVTLDTMPAAGTEITLKVRNADGQESAPFKVKVGS